MRNTFKKTLPYVLLAVIAVSSVATLNACTGACTEITEADSTQKTAAVTGTTVESRLVERHTVEYIEKPVTTVEYVERVRTEPIELRNFRSLDELDNWLKTDTGATIHLQSNDTDIDCDDYAMALQQKALKEGYIVSFEIIERNEYNSLFESSIPEGQNLHAINLAIIGNSAYYIEPQTGEVVFAVNLD